MNQLAGVACCSAQNPEMAPPVLEGSEQGGLGMTSLAPFFDYCAACHTSAPHDFLAGSEETVLTSLRNRKSEILKRLSAGNGSTDTMPPKQSQQHVDLMKAENVGKVLEMKIGPVDVLI